MERLSAIGGDDEEVGAPAIEVAPAVELVIEALGHPRDRAARRRFGSALGRARIGDDALRVADDGAPEGDPATVRRPFRPADTELESGQLARIPHRRVEQEELLDVLLPADVRQSPAVGRPLRRIVLLARRHLGDNIPAAGAADVNLAPVVDRLPVGTADDVGDLVAGRAQPHVVDPAEVVNVVGGEGRSRHQGRFKHL